MKHDIPNLTSVEDGFVRSSYFGGATDYYTAHAKNLHYYDVNSLYPYSMCKPIPHKISYYINDMSEIDLNNFFGFCKAKITCSKNISRPVLPYKLDTKTIFPTAGTATWIGTYFSEELKAVSKLGYKIELISGYAFTKEYLFNEYVDHFYNQKKVSTGPQRFIANGTAAFKPVIWILR